MNIVFKFFDVRAENKSETKLIKSHKGYSECMAIIYRSSEKNKGIEDCIELTKHYWKEVFNHFEKHGHPLIKEEYEIRHKRFVEKVKPMDPKWDETLDQLPDGWDK